MQNIVKNTWFKVLIVLVVLAVVLAGLYFSGVLGDRGRYSIVYMTTGQVYVGQLTNILAPRLENAYIYQVLQDPADPSKNTFNLNPVHETLWSPEAMYLNKDHIAFYALLKLDSQIVQAIQSQTE